MISFGSNRLGEKIDALTGLVQALVPGIDASHGCTHARLDELTTAVAELATEIEHTCEASQKLLQMVEGLTTSQAALTATLTAMAEQVLTELQQTRNRTERTDGRAERLEFALEDLFGWLRERDQTPPDWAVSQDGFQARPRRALPAFPRTQSEVPDLDERRAARDGRLALKGGG